MKIKTSELTGPALDWAVAKAEEATQGFVTGYFAGMVLRGNFSPSTNWSQGGPIIEREKIELKYLPYDRPPYWGALKSNTAAYARSGQIGPTALIAAMRCFVASRLGDEVDVPEELL